MTSTQYWEIVYGVIFVTSFLALCLVLVWKDKPIGDVNVNLPQGVRNNNPGNLRSGGKYEGLAIPAVVGGFLNFLLAMWGFRAIFRNYITKSDKGINTIRKLISEWSPPEDNKSASDPDGTKQLAAYIAEVSHRSGFGPDEEINLKSWAVASQICYAQTVVENGSFDAYFKRADMEQGAFRAGIMDAPAPLSHKVEAKVASTAGVGTVIAATVQTQVENAMQAQHSPMVQFALLGLLCAILLYLGFIRQHVKAS